MEELLKSEKNLKINSNPVDKKIICSRTINFIKEF